MDEVKKPGPISNPNIQYQQDIEYNAVRFLNAVQSYKGADYTQKDELKEIMDRSLQVIRSAVHSIKERNIYEQEAKLENDYQSYMNDTTDDRLTTLEEDVSNLKNLNNLIK